MKNIYKISINTFENSMDFLKILKNLHGVSLYVTVQKPSSELLNLWRSKHLKKKPEMSCVFPALPPRCGEKVAT